jgi:hypothetical protein
MLFTTEAFYVVTTAKKGENLIYLLVLPKNSVLN